jgi:hypothetical protein
VLERGDGAYVLDVLEPGGGGANGGGANGGGTRRQYVWGGAELAKRPAAAERMAAVLLARSLHSCDHRGASELVQLDEAPRVEALRGPGAAAAGKPRAFSGEVRSLPGLTPTLALTLTQALTLTLILTLTLTLNLTQTLTITLTLTLTPTLTLTLTRSFLLWATSANVEAVWRM